jgi:hypothetical protein
MRKTLASGLICLIVLAFSCSKDEMKPARIKMVVNGEPVEVNEVRVTRSTWSDNTFNDERLEFFGKIRENENLIIYIQEYGTYDKSGVLQGGGIRPRIYQEYGRLDENVEDCVAYNGWVLCDYFYLYLSPPNGAGMYLENVTSQLEILSYDTERMKVVGTFSVTGTRSDNGLAFSLTGEFDSHFRNSPQ